MKARHKVALTTWGVTRPDAERLGIELWYSPADPYAARITFLRDGRRSEWFVGRDLLRDGLTRLTGQGDAQIWPTDDGVNVALTLVGVDEDTGEERVCLVEMPRSQLAKFLHDSYALVPAGAEDMTDAVDEVLASLLGGDE